MIILYALIFSLVQALTEFWPISSSGHLVLLHDVFRVDLVDNMTFDVALHIGTALALLVYFWADIARYWKAFLTMFRGFNIAQDDQKTVVNIILATIPAILVGLIFDNAIEKYLRSVLVVAIALFVGGVIILIVEHYSKRRIPFEGLSLPEAILIGLAQAIALIPGVSRSGATIIAGMALNLKRVEAARFSFLLSIPVVLAAGIKKLFDVQLMTLSNREVYLLIFGAMATFITGYLVIKGFLKYIESHSLKVFAWYRIIVGAILLSLVVLKVIS